ncbi:MAG: hypothetical protein IPG69_05020 [Flavobacteriales bacterium]|nr:hypothetical protein [Flavobacteriales bacterium]
MPAPSIAISILATVEFSGFEVDVGDLPVILTVLPGTGSISVSPSRLRAAAPVTSTFGPLIATRWRTGHLRLGLRQREPLHRRYSAATDLHQAGDHLVTLTTSIGGYQLDQVELVKPNGNWCGDVEEPNIPSIGCTGSPDLLRDRRWERRQLHLVHAKMMRAVPLGAPWA